MEGAFDAAVRANVEKDGQLAFLREQLAVVAAQQPQHQEAHTASAAAGEEAADAEISELRSQLAALQSGDVPIAGLPEVGEGACSSQVNAASATLLALTSSQVQAPAEGPVLSLQQLAAGWLSDDGEQPQAASTDPVSSGSAGIDANRSTGRNRPLSTHRDAGGASQLSRTGAHRSSQRPHDA